MIRPSLTRDRLNEVIDQYGIKVSFIANKLDWDYTNLTKFRNAQVNISLKRERLLNEFLDKFDKQDQVG